MATRINSQVADVDEYAYAIVELWREDGFYSVTMTSSDNIYQWEWEYETKADAVDKYNVVIDELVSGCFFE